MMPIAAIRMARAAGLLCAVAALFAFSKDWTRQVPLNTKGGLVLLVIGLAAAAGAHRGSRLALRVTAAVSTAMAAYLFVTFGRSSLIDGGAAAAVLLLGLATVLVGATMVDRAVPGETAPLGQARS